MGKLTLNGISNPKPHLIEQCRGHGAKAMGGHLVLAVSHAP
ncbi:hypothetical protein FHT51_003653 [Novosphingobium sp. BK352]|nr:hypothetical protein [Novosphingobium sp. BK352]